MSKHKIDSSVFKEKLTVEQLNLISHFLTDWSFFLNQKSLKMRLGQYIIYKLNSLGEDVNFPQMFYYEGDKELEDMLWKVIYEVLG